MWFWLWFESRELVFNQLRESAMNAPCVFVVFEGFRKNWLLLLLLLLLLLVRASDVCRPLADHLPLHGQQIGERRA